MLNSRENKRYLSLQSESLQKVKNYSPSYDSFMPETKSNVHLSSASRSEFMPNINKRDNLDITRRIFNDSLRLRDLINSPNRLQCTSNSCFTSHNENFYQFNKLIDAQTRSEYLSEVEEKLLKSTEPLEFDTNGEDIEVLGQRGIWLNKNESVNWQGETRLCEYELNQDHNPQHITKKTNFKINYIQEMAVRYLRPPTPPLPGEIIIRQERNTIPPPAPPLIIRQQPARPSTPEPLVIREAPPQPPKPVGRKIITIVAKKLPPPPRKVIIERLPRLPSKPQSVIIERWLPYKPIKRKVIYQKPSDQVPVYKTKNVIIQWENPQVNCSKQFKDLGIIKANPVEYIQKYGSSLKKTEELPNFVHDILPPKGISLANSCNCSQKNLAYDLEGDVEALSYIDLDKEGLSEYKHYIENLFPNQCPSRERKQNLVSSSNYHLDDSSSNVQGIRKFSQSTNAMDNPRRNYSSFREDDF